jgi:hypothetical protein
MTKGKGGGTSSSSVPNTAYIYITFDAATNQHLFWVFRMPTDFASGPVLKVQWNISSTTGNVVWEGRIAANTPGDATTPGAEALAAANSVTTAVNGTTFRLTESSITLTNADSVAAGDYVILMLKRDAANASDTAAASAILNAVTLEYTTV